MIVILSAIEIVLIMFNDKKSLDEYQGFFYL